MKPESKKPRSRKSKAAKPDTDRTQPPLQKSVIQHSTDGIMITSEKGTIIEWNPAMERITGLKKDEVLEQEFCDVQFRLAPKEQRTPELRKQLTEGMRRIVEDIDTSWSGQLQEVEIQRANGERCIIETIPFYLKTNSGVITVSIHCDVNERKRAEEKLRESEERFRLIFESAKDCLFIKDENLKYTHVNPAMEKLFGVSLSELIGRSDSELFGEKAAYHITEIDTRVLKGETIEDIDTKPIHGVPTTFHVIKAPMYSNKGEVIGLCGIARDITGQKRAEEALQESEERYRTLFEISGDGILIADVGTKQFKYANPAICKMLDYTEEEMTSLGVVDIHPKESIEHVLSEFEAQASGTKPLAENIPCLRKDREVVYADFNTVPAVIDGTKCNIGIVRDITERKRVEEELGKYRHQLEELVEERTEELKKELFERKKTEEALRESEEKFKGLVESSSDWIWEVDKNGVYIYVSPKVEEMLGYIPKEVIGKTPFDMMPPKEAERIAETFKGYVERREPIVALENVGLHKDGRRVVLETSGVPILDEAGNIHGYRGVDRDITDRKNTTEALRESEQKLRNVFESVSEGIFTLDLNGVYTEVNKRVLDMYGLNSTDEILGKSGFQFVAPHDAERAKDGMQTVLEQGTVLCQEFAALQADGSEFNVEISGTLLKDDSGDPIGITGIARDITERKRVEEELRNTERLESLGFLAGGIAHDFNNLLGGIFGNIQLAMVNSSSKEKVLKSLERAMQAMQRAKDLTHQLLTFSSGGAPIIELISIRNVITESVTFALSGSNIHPSFSIDQNLWPVEADQGQLHQVFNNILLNARQAMPEGGKVEITAKNLNIEVNKGLPFKEGMYVRIAIKDNGIGMPEGILEKIFDPFFTTKQSGSGLGLSICYSIVKKHNGHITVDATPGAGSVFTIYLPASEKEIQSEPEKQVEVLQGEGKILIMDDEPIICEMLAGELELLGYEVEVTYNGDEAIQAYGEAVTSGKKFDAVILDLTVPGGKGGKETITELQNIDPAIKAIVSSGYSDNPVIANPKEYGFRGAIEKPYKMEALSQILYDLLTGKNNSRG